MDELLSIYQQIINSMPNFKVRHSQLEMVKQIADCYGNIQEACTPNGHNICLVEAPTGTGKSIAYLLAGVLYAKRLGKKYIISTATKALQEQLINKDIPVFIKYSGIRFTYSLAKGRSNYLCPYQLELSLSENQGDMFTQGSNLTDTLGVLSELFANGNWDGDLSVAPVPVDYKIKSLITIDKDRCLNSLCVFNQKDNCSCPYFRKRLDLKNSDVIVTNHSLLLSDIILGGGVVLPSSPENYLLCIDEGHTFPSIAIDSFTGNFGLKSGLTTCNNLSKFIYNADTQTYIHGVDISLCSDIAEKTSSLIDELDKILRLLTENLGLFKNDQLIINDYLEPSAGVFKEYFANCVYVSSELLEKLVKVQDKFKEELKEGSNYTIEANMSKLGFYISEVEKILAVSQYIINKDDSRYNANAKWVELKISNNDKDFFVNAGLTHSGRMLVNGIFSRVYGAIIVSATLSINGDFRHYLHKFGLNLYDQVKSRRLSGSFNYNKQAQIVVPKFSSLPEYNTRNEFTKELANYLYQKVINYDSGYGTLVLFFNKSQLNETYSLLPKSLQKNIISQTDFIGTQRLISEHKRRIDQGLPSIIFGLNSFAEGVDLPSLYCIHVVITKLPFDAHNTPINLVQEYWFKFEGANFFTEVSLPETCIKLIQASGRLIRSEEDYGQLTICDNRIVTKGYGTMLLNALPEFNRIYDKEFLANAYEKIRATSR